MRQQAPWTSEDVTAVQTIGNILGPVRVLIHEETRMTTETAPEDFTGGEDSGWDGATGANVAPTATHPEYPYSLADHVYTWSPKLPDGSMLVIRSQTADGLVEAVETVAPLAQRLTAAWRAVAAQPQTPAMAGGFQPAAAPQQFNQQPAQPFPNQPFPGQPAWQQAGAPQAPAPQWGGGQQAAQGANGRQGPKPRPTWPQVYKINVPFNSKDAFKAFREENKDVLKGKVAWAGGGDYWIEGSVVQGFAQYNPMAA
jgi:hypothetical protein